MNTPASQPAVLPRLAAARVQRAFDAMPVVVMGARQTGKSTLVRTLPGAGARDRM